MAINIGMVVEVDPLVEGGVDAAHGFFAGLLGQRGRIPASAQGHAAITDTGYL